MFSDIPWVWFVVLCVASIAGAMLGPVLRRNLHKRDSRKQEGPVQNWTMPNDVIQISGMYRYQSFSSWPNVIEIDHILYVLTDMRKDTSFVPDRFEALVTLWVRPADPKTNRRAELWWADYGVHLDADEAVKEAERLVK